MNNKTWTIILIALIAGTAIASAQDCTTALDRAGKSYEAGDFREIVATLSPCIESGMSSEDQWQAYRLLALAHLFLDQPQEADTAIQSMLTINPRYQPNPGRDPIELIRPLRTYGSYPRVFAGIKGGLSYTGREITRSFSVAGVRDFTIDNKFTLGSDLGLLVDLNIMPAVALSTEVLYSSRKFSYTATNLLTINQNYTEQLTWLTVPLLVKYRIGDGLVEPYLYAGYFVQALLGATSDLQATQVNATADTLHASEQVKSSFADNGLRTTEDHRNPLNHGITLGGGIVYKLGEGALVLDLRYAHGLAPVVKADQRFSDQETIYKYLYIDNDFQLRDVSLTIGYVLQLSFTSYRK